MSNASNLSNLANVLDDGSDGQFLKSTGSGGVAFDTVAAGAVVYATADLLPLSGNSAGDMAYVTSTNRFYINNGSGWYSVSLVNTTPNITSVQDAGSNTTPFTLATDQTATVITITAADPEDVPLTYGYSVTSGSLNGSTVAQGTGSNTNVFTVTPHASQDATFTITFTASDGINQATSANEFSLSFVTVVTDSNHTTLLATAASSSGIPYSFSGLSYANKSFSFTSQDSSNNGLAFNPNGTKMYMTGSANDVIYQYSLNPAWDVSTASYDNVSLSMSGYSSGSQYSIEFKSDGSVMYISDNSQDSIDIYTVSSGSEYVLNQYSYNSTKSLSAISGITNLRSIIFKPDGSKFFALCNATNKVYEFTMSTYWDVANAQHSSSDTYDVFSAVSESSPRSAYVTPDGTQLLVSGTDNDKIHRFVLTSPWQVNSATYTSGDDFDFTGTFSTSTCSTMVASDDGTFLYLNTTNNDTVYQYNFTSNNNSTITDSSSNNHNITVTGDAYAGTFSPYRSGGYSGLFDSTSVVQLSFAGSSDFEFGSVNFTIEMWFKWNSSNKPETTIFSNRISGSTFSTGRYFLKLMPGDITTGGIEFAFDCGSPRYRLNCVDNLTADDAFFDEGWHHYAAVRDGTSLKLFVDGQEVDEITLPANETNFGNSSDNIGLGINNGVSSPDGPDGEYRDVRIVKGVAITPPSGGPTETLDAVSGTTFLLYNGEGYVKDKTSNHSPIYGSTAPTITATSPYDYEEYSETDHGGSVYFVGGADFSSQYLSLSGPTMPSGDFTLSTWAYLTSASDSTLIDFNGNSGGFRILYANGTNGYHFRFYTAGGTVYLYDQSIAHPLNQWHYIVVVRDSGTFKLYVNNKLINTSTATPTFSSSNNVRIGQMLSGYGTLEGYLSDIIYNPTTAITDFTPPTAPLSSSGASLHIKGTDASIIDKSQGANLKLIGNTTGSTTQAKFSNTKSMYFDGSGDYVFVPASSLLDISSSDITIEGYFYTTSTSVKQGVWEFYSDDNNYARLFFEGGNGNVLRLTLYSSGTQRLNATGTTALSINTWYHIAVTRDHSSGAWKTFIGGFQDTGASGTESAAVDTSLWNFEIGRDLVATDRYWAGYIQDFRITKGLARYTAADETANIPTAPLEG